MINMWELMVLILVTVITAAVSLCGGFLLLSGSKLAAWFQKIGPFFAAAVLLYAALFDIVPEVLEDGDLPVWGVVLLVIGGLAICEVLGLVLGKYHRHGEEERELKGKHQATAMLIVDSLHNIADGVVMGTAFAGGLSTGLLTATATAAHEIPQEVGDFSIMMRAKIPKRKIAKLQTISALLLVPVAVVAYFIGDMLLPALPVFLSLVAGFLLYIALGEIAVIIRMIKDKRPKLMKKRVKKEKK